MSLIPWPEGMNWTEKHIDSIAKTESLSVSRVRPSRVVSGRASHVKIYAESIRRKRWFPVPTPKREKPKEVACVGFLQIRSQSKNMLDSLIGDSKLSGGVSGNGCLSRSSLCVHMMEPAFPGCQPPLCDDSSARLQTSGNLNRMKWV